MSPLRSARFGLIAGALVAVLVAAAMTAWDWLENPAGIFRGAEGTRWNFVWDTLWSWLLPTFAYAVVIAFFCHLLAAGIRRWARKRKNS